MDRSAQTRRSPRRDNHTSPQRGDVTQYRDELAYLGPAANRNAICTTSAIGLASGPPVRAGSKRIPGMTFLTAAVSSGLGELTTSKVPITGVPFVSTLKRTR